MPFVPDKSSAGRFVPDKPPGYDANTGQIDPELAQVDAMMRAREAGTFKDTPQPSLMQRAGSYVGDYTRGIRDAGARLAVAAGTRPNEQIGGALEAGLSLGTGLIAPLSAAMGTLTQGKGGREVSPEEFTYQPRTQTGRAILDVLGSASRPISDSGIDVALGPLAMEAGAIPGLPRRAPPPTAEEIVSQLRPSAQSVGASSSSSSAAVATASPQLQQAVVKAAAKHPDAVNPDVLGRHVEADTLPVPVQLTKGQATQDPVILSRERNARAAQPELSEHFNTQERQLGENLQAVRDDAGPDVFTTNATEHGDTLISAYKAKDAAAEAEIDAAYKAARDANGGNLPMDGRAFVYSADAALKKNMKGRYVPAEIAADLAEIRDSGSMNFETFENLRTNLAAEARKADRSGDGNAAGAIRLVRDALENIEPAGEAIRVKPLFDKARTLSRSRFQALEADPAYKAVVDEKIAPDNFVRRFITGGTRDKVALMRKNLSNDQTAAQTVSAATVDHLRQAAGLDNLGNGKFSQARFNKALTALNPKLRELVSAQVAETLQKIGNVGRYIQEQPAGSFVNNSNTLTAMAGEVAKTGTEQAVNAAFKGIPVGTVGRGILGNRRMRNEMRRSMQPGAGLNYPTRQRLLAEQLKK